MFFNVTKLTAQRLLPIKTPGIQIFEQYSPKGERLLSVYKQGEKTPFRQVLQEQTTFADKEGKRLIGTESQARTKDSFFHCLVSGNETLWTHTVTSTSNIWKDGSGQITHERLFDSLGRLLLDDAHGKPIDTRGYTKSQYTYGKGYTFKKAVHTNMAGKNITQINHEDGTITRIFEPGTNDLDFGGQVGEKAIQRDYTLFPYNTDWVSQITTKDMQGNVLSTVNYKRGEFKFNS